MVKPSNAKPMSGFGLCRIDVAYKHARGVHLNPKERAEFWAVCTLGADQIVDCYGCFELEGNYHNVFDFLSMCDGCQYARKHFTREQILGIDEPRGIFEGRYVEELTSKYREEKDPKAFVYFVSDGQFVKIGKANDVSKRISTLQISSPRKLEVLAVIPCVDNKAASEIEGLFHAIYHEYHIRGEWYDILKQVEFPYGIKWYFSEDTRLWG